MKRFPFVAVLILLLLSASPAAAYDFGRFWVGFKSFWGNQFGSIGGVVGLGLLTGAVSVFIITRGKWKK